MYDIYEVKQGDTLDSISKKFNVPFYDIIQLNNLQNAYTLMSGQELKIPVASSSAFRYYQVQRGDTVYGISRKFNIDLNVLLALNSLTSNSYIYPGQELLVPQEGVTVYLTKPGDSIGKVAREANTSLDEFLIYNDKVYLLPEQIIVYKKRN